MQELKRCKLEEKFQAQGSLPEDLSVEILQRLPVRSLLRFQCISKSWQSLIIDPSFRLHSISADSHSIFCYCLCGDPDDPKDQFYWLKFECSETSDDDVIDHLRIQLHKFDVYKGFRSSNGLICYADFVNYGFDHFPVSVDSEHQSLQKVAFDLVNEMFLGNLVEFSKLFRPSCVHRLYLFELGESVALYEAADEFHKGCLWVSTAESINDRNSGMLTWFKLFSVVIDDAKDLLTDKRLLYSLQIKLKHHENIEKPDLFLL
ncbi:hypothetical protein Cgig2_015692 [Carnegiea gigantea]|uniref:F-box domain-containing protein n=1 Tax=Carnegiea gigantea TaxID=171969 RepID=A0A9Q1GQT6_9CARY|nr:hypothetical protein Cgig2_015692 [Carnegiea gigantea]